MDNHSFISKKRRNRLSYVCQNCKKSKTKCDKTKPSCNRCKKLNIYCIYENINLENLPKNLNNLSVFKNLNNELQFWKNLALQNQNQNNNTDYSILDPHNIPIFNDSFNLTSAQLETIQFPLQLYRSHPTLIINKTMKRDVKPLSENYCLIKDTFLSILISAVFLNQSPSNSLISVLTSNVTISRIKPIISITINKLKSYLMNQSISKFQSKRIEAFIDRLVAYPTCTQEKSGFKDFEKNSDQLQSSNNNTKNNINNNMKNTSVNDIFPLFFKKNNSNAFIEDYCPPNDTYSDILLEFIKTFENFLPPLHVINVYKSHFYTHIFNVLPFLDKTMFEETINSIIFKDIECPDKKIKLHLGHSSIRSKMEHLAILAMVLKLSYISLRMKLEQNPNMQILPTLENDTKINYNEIIDKYPIENDAITLAEKLLSSENLFACTNENIITCLLYIWAFFVFSPDEGDFFIEHPTDIIAGLIVMLATSIGLHRDPSAYSNLQSCIATDKRLLNHRRLLWIAVVSASLYESTLKGRYGSYTTTASQCLFIGNIREDDSLDVYLEKVKADMDPHYLDKTLLDLHEISFKRMQISILLYDLDNLIMDHTRSHSLASIEIAMRKIDTFVDENFPLELKDPVIGFSPSPVFLTSLQTRFMSDLMLLRTSIALLLHFEDLLANEEISLEQGLPLYFTYFNKIAFLTIKVVNHFCRFFNDESSLNYMVTKMAQLTLVTTLFCLLGVIMRLELAFISINNDERQSDPNFVEKQKILKSLQTVFENAMIQVHYISSRYLRFTYYSVFKMLGVCDIIVNYIRNGDLWANLLKIKDLCKNNPILVKGLTISLNLNLTDIDSIFDDLKNKNFLIEIPNKELNTLLVNIKHEQNLRNSHNTNDNISTATTTNTAYMNSTSLNQGSSSNTFDKLSVVANILFANDFCNNKKGKKNDTQSEENSTNDQINVKQHISTGTSQLSSIPTSFQSAPPHSNTDSSTEETIQSTSNVDTNPNPSNNISTDDLLFNADTLDIPGGFGGLDLFDYDFLFGT